MNAEHSEKDEGYDGWIPVALSADLPNAGVMRAQIDAAQPLDLVVWRSRSSHVSAFDNRCPHRGMRLSFGFVRGERLSCIYHGWQYGEDGACRHIPAHPDMTPPTSIGANTYLCREHDGVIWISHNADNPPDLPTFDGQGLRSLSVNRDEADLRKLLAETCIPVSGAGETAPADVSTIAENQTSLVLEAASLQLMIHFQKVTAEKTMLHIQTSPDLPVDLRISLSRWAERFRWSAENMGTMVNSWDARVGEAHP